MHEKICKIDNFVYLYKSRIRKDTAFGKYFEVFDGLPDDTVLCIKIQPIHIDDDKYAYAKDLLRCALQFDLVRPEPEVEAGK